VEYRLLILLLFLLKFLSTGFPSASSYNRKTPCTRVCDSFSFPTSLLFFLLSLRLIEKSCPLILSAHVSAEKEMLSRIFHLSQVTCTILHEIPPESGSTKHCCIILDIRQHEFLD
jgi:hypothetical protein